MKISITDRGLHLGFLYDLIMEVIKFALSFYVSSRMRSK